MSFFYRCCEHCDEDHLDHDLEELQAQAHKVPCQFCREGSTPITFVKSFLLDLDCDPDDWVEWWHTHQTPETLMEILGLTTDQMDRFAEDPETLLAQMRGEV